MEQTQRKLMGDVAVQNNLAIISFPLKLIEQQRALQH